MENSKIILASSSPRRKDLMKLIRDKFKVIAPKCDENVISYEPEAMTIELSRQKAQAVQDGKENTAGTIIIAADTVVSVDGSILGKPKDREEANGMLHALKGKQHQVTTGVTIFWVDLQGEVERKKSFAETTLVWVDALTEEEIETYLDAEEYIDKAGAYGIQGLFGKHISRIQGDYNNVVGLPIRRLYTELKKMS